MCRDWCVFARRQRRLRGVDLLEQLHETRLQKLEQGHDMLSRDYSRLNDAIVKISDSLTALVVIQEQNKTIMQHVERNSILIEKSSSRIDEIERHQPQLLELRNWVLTGLGLIISAVVVAMIALVIK